MSLGNDRRNEYSFSVLFGVCKKTDRLSTRILCARPNSALATTKYRQSDSTGGNMEKYKPLARPLFIFKSNSNAFYFQRQSARWTPPLFDHQNDFVFRHFLTMHSTAFAELCDRVDCTLDVEENIDCEESTFGICENRKYTKRQLHRSKSRNCEYHFAHAKRTEYCGDPWGDCQKCVATDE